MKSTFHKTLVMNNKFGASAPGETVMREYGFTVENVCRHAQRLLKHSG